MATNNPWQIENLIRKALQRTKDRFLSFLIAAIIQYIIIFVGIAVVFLIVGLFAAVLFTLKTTISTIIIAFLAIIGIIYGALVIIYLVSWSQLTLTTIIIQKENIGVIDTYKKTRPRVWGFVWFNIALNLFLLGLVPFGIMSLGLIFFLWVFWNAFSVIVFIEKQKIGLDNLWISRSLINQRFWGIAGRLVLIYALFYIIVISLASVDSAVLNAINFVLSIFFGPFLISYMYEIYSLLKIPKVIERPKGWIILSIIGYFLAVVMFIIGFSLLPQIMNTFIKKAPYIPPKVVDYPAT